ncbi:MAG: alpha/beta hydrolase, partial [Acidimicrobiales bacterium]
VRGLVVCHGFPAGPRGAATTAETYPALADRLAAEAGWTVLVVNLRGTGGSEGDFSLAGWLSDLHRAVAYLRSQPEVSGVWLAGFGAGGALALCAAGEDEGIGGVASFGAPADFEQWAADPAGALVQARALGLVRSKEFPPSFDQWAREWHEIRPLVLVAKVPPRPVLLVHGAADEAVPMMDARALADAAGGSVELRTLSGAGERLRHDPRAVALLLGWLYRQE